MLVTKSNFNQALKEIIAWAKIHKALSYDTETTTLHWWDSPFHSAMGIRPRVFAIQIATGEAEYYFDFHYADDKLSDGYFRRLNDELTSNTEILWFIANAKFDLHHSRNHGIEFAGLVHCTKAISRVVNNLEPSTKLDDLGKLYLGEGKFLDMAAVCKEKGYFTPVKKYGHNDKFEDALHFDRIDAATMVEYGKIDVRRCYDLGVYQIQKVREIDENIHVAKGVASRLKSVLQNEIHLTKVLFEMEREGVRIDRAYTEEAYENEVAEYRRIESELDRLSKAHIETKIDWNSAQQLKPLFDALGEPYSYTKKGNASFDKDALEDSDSEFAKHILTYRYHYKRAHTYFENFIWLADANNVIHADAQQAGTQFARMSYWQPNLQNVPKRNDKDEAKYKVRRCFIPKPGTLLLDKDYKGAEYYMSMDYAKEMGVIEELKTGLDPHKRLGAEMSIERDPAKTMQFRILYGGGGKAVGRALGYKGLEADRIGKAKKKEYFSRMPALAQLICNVAGGWLNGRRYIGIAESRGYIFNWFGRILQYTKATAYAAFNGLIQSGVGDMTKVAMVDIHHNVLPGHKTRMLLQVHDAILFQFYPDEAHLLPLIDQAMCKAYPHKLLPMKTDSGFSAQSWADLHSEMSTVT